MRFLQYFIYVSDSLSYILFNLSSLPPLYKKDSPPLLLLPECLLNGSDGNSVVQSWFLVACEGLGPAQRSRGVLGVCLAGGELLPADWAVDAAVVAHGCYIILYLHSILRLTVTA